MADGLANVIQRDRLQRAADFPYCRQPSTLCAWSFDALGRLRVRRGALWEDPESLLDRVEHGRPYPT